MFVLMTILFLSDSGQPHKPYYRDLSDYGELLKPDADFGMFADAGHDNV